MRKEAEIEQFRRVLEELRDKTILVEGKKDVRALEGLGLDVIAINGRTAEQLVPLLEGKDLVILTDFDRAGREIEARLKYLLQRYKINSNSRLRCKVMSLGKGRIEDFRKISSLERFENKEGDCYGQTGPDINKIHNPCLHQSQRCSGEAGCDRCDFWAD
jgi:5S rRNA maturation endonuclease (ribonuclease M5)